MMSTCAACLTLDESNQMLIKGLQVLTLHLQHPFLSWVVIKDAFPLQESPLHNIAQLVYGHMCQSSSKSMFRAATGKASGLSLPCHSHTAETTAQLKEPCSI